MKHLIYISPRADLYEKDFDELKNKAIREPGALLDECKNQDGIRIYDDFQTFSDDFNEGEISDEGLILTLDDGLTEHQKNLQDIKQLIIKKGTASDSDPDTLVLLLAPLTFIRHGADWEFLETDTDSGIEMPVEDRHGYWQNCLMVSAELKHGEVTFNAVSTDGFGDFALMPYEIDSDTMDALRHRAEELTPRQIEAFRLFDIAFTQNNEKAIDMILDGKPNRLVKKMLPATSGR